eukprot:1156705-Pelagomonas_calceolata.AAC.4
MHTDALSQGCGHMAGSSKDTTRLEDTKGKGRETQILLNCIRPRMLPSMHACMQETSSSLQQHLLQQQLKLAVVLQLSTAQHNAPASHCFSSEAALMQHASPLPACVSTTLWCSAHQHRARAWHSPAVMAKKRRRLSEMDPPCPKCKGSTRKACAPALRKQVLPMPRARALLRLMHTKKGQHRTALIEKHHKAATASLLHAGAPHRYKGRAHGHTDSTQL